MKQFKNKEEAIKWLENLSDDELLLFRDLFVLNPKEENYNYFTLKIPKLLQTPMLQYIEFFKDYVKATKDKEVIFDVKRDKAGLILITNGNTGVTLPELGKYFQEYVGLVQKDLDKWIPNFDNPKTPIEADIFRLKLQTEVSSLTSKLDIARFEANSLNKQLADKEKQVTFLMNLSNNLQQDIRLLIEGRNIEC